MAAESAEKLHQEMLARLEKGSGRFSNFFQNWIKFEDNGERLFKARGAKGESFMLARLADYEVSKALVVLETVMNFWDGERFALYINAEDDDGNGIWHYLADNLRLNEGRDTLKFAHILIKLDVDFARRNKYGISPLGKMLVPEPKWQSINALIQTKHLQIVNVENAVAEQAKGDQAKLANMMCGIFAGDLADNRALLSQHVLKQAVQSNTDKEQRQATCRLFFDYVNAEDGTTAFHKLLGHANTAMFEDLLGLLMQQTEETVMGMSPPDVATKKVYRQAVLCRRLLKRDKARRTLFAHCLLLGKTGLPAQADRHAAERRPGDQETGPRRAAAPAGGDRQDLCRPAQPAAVRAACARPAGRHAAAPGDPAERPGGAGDADARPGVERRARAFDQGA